MATIFMIARAEGGWGLTRGVTLEEVGLFTAQGRPPRTENTALSSHHDFKPEAFPTDGAQGEEVAGRLGDGFIPTASGFRNVVVLL